MRDGTAAAERRTAIYAINPSVQAGESNSLTSEISDRELLAYMGDLLAELKEMAAAARFEGLADLLGYAQRETERNHKGK